MTDFVQQTLVDYQEREAIAESIVPLTGRLYRDQAVVSEVFGVSLVRKSPMRILQIHDEASKKSGQPIHPSETAALLSLMNELSLGRTRIDLGKLILRFRDSSESDLAAWTRTKLAAVSATEAPMPERHQDVILYGFGRIGRLLARILIDKTGGGDKYRLRAIVLRPGSENQLERRASLLIRDSVHGPFDGIVEVDRERSALVINGNVVHVLYASSPDQLDYAGLGIQDAVVIDNTGKWRDTEGLGLHLKSTGVSRVVLTAPGKGIPNIVFGVNHHTLDKDTPIISAASCTTNAIVPPLAIIEKRWGIRHGHVETVHSYTNDQNLIDNFHRKDRRGRSAPLNLVITSTGAAKAAALALPELAGKLTGSAIRVPTPNVSLAILNLQLESDVTVEALNAHFRQIAVDSPLAAQIDVTTSPEIVSSDLVGSSHAGVVDVHATIGDGRTAVVYVWYDNEYGYSCQVIRLMQHLAGVSPRHFPV